VWSVAGSSGGGPSAAPGAPAKATAFPDRLSPADGEEPVESWRPGGATGLTGPVSDVLVDAPATGPVRVVTLVEDADGRPRIEVTVAADRTVAEGAVEAARAVPGALAVTVDQPVHAAHVGSPAPVTEAAAAQVAQGTVGAAASSDDTYRSLQWALDRLAADAAWALQTGTGQTVAVVDTGVDGTHPDLAPRLLPGADFIDVGGDGRIDPNGHGTHVAGIIGAVANNAQGIAGLAPTASILPVRVLGADGSGWTSGVADGLIWAADHGAAVANLSLSGSTPDSVLATAVQYAQSKDVVVVAAAGNERQNGNPVRYPAAFPGVLAVAATDSADGSASFSSTGSYVGIAAPGYDIVATYPVARGGYVSLSGTSMASPYAAAAAALIRAHGPGLTATQVVDTMVATASDLGPVGRDDEFGAGLIDVIAALEAAGYVGPPAVPGAPGTPAAQPQDRGAVVSWSPGVANGSPITGYTVTATPGGATATTTGATRVTVTGLTNGTSYTFSVTATNARGTGPASAASAAVTPVSSASPVSTYQAVAPVRLLDTRDGTGAPAGGVGPGGTISLQVTGLAGVPASGVTAVVLNVTAVAPTTSSFVTVYPSGQPRPLASNLNITAGSVRPNLVVVQVGADGKVSLFNSGGRTDLVADLAGYYTD
jgi:serine protease